MIRKIGIYKIYCCIDNKSYIGSSVNLNVRLGKHKNMLRRGIHKNNHLQNAWNLYGEINFSFEIVEIVEDKFWLRAREQAWINRLRCFDRDYGYNKSRDSFYSSPIDMSLKEAHNTVEARINYSKAAIKWQNDPNYRDSIKVRSLKRAEQLRGTKQKECTKEKRRKSMLAFFDEKTGLTREERIEKRINRHKYVSKEQKARKLELQRIRRLKIRNDKNLK